MGIEVGSLIFVLALLAGMIFLAEIGAQKARKEGSSSGGGVVESSLFGLLGLLLAFAFTGASTRLDARRDLVIQEANSLGTAALRLSLLKEPTLARAALSDYIQTRLEYGEALGTNSAKDAWIASQASQSDLWKTVLLSIDPTDKQTEELLVLPPLNDAFDLASERNVMTEVHLPWPVQGMLALLALLCSWIAGRMMPESTPSKRIIRWSLAFVVCLTIMLIKDLDYPRLGFIKVSGSDQLLREVKESLVDIDEGLALPQ